jgi:putative ABC transport system permease protein
MNTFQLFRVALRALAINKLRSALTMLGIVIGVAAVIVMIAVGAGAQRRVEEQIRALGANMLLVMPGSVTAGRVRMGYGSASTLDEDDVAAINREIPEAIAAPAVRGPAQVVWGNANWSTTVYGVTPVYLDVRQWPLHAGRGFEATEMSAAGKVCLLGSTVARQLFGSGDPVGETIRIRRVPFLVIGVLESKGQSLMGQDQDDVILVPLTTARTRIMGSPVFAKRRMVGHIWVRSVDGAPVSHVEAQVRALLRQRHNLRPGMEDDFSMRNLDEVMAAQEESSRVLALLLAAVASISLLVGGIGIMNIMLVSVTERTREIGLRMAVGARTRDILGQFLVEAVTLSLIGGLVGVALGIGAAIAVSAWLGWHIAISAEAVVLAVAFSFVIGVFFGYYPARKAARLSPVEALRFE